MTCLLYASITPMAQLEQHLTRNQIIDGVRATAARTRDMISAVRRRLRVPPPQHCRREHRRADHGPARAGHPQLSWRNSAVCSAPRRRGRSTYSVGHPGGVVRRHRPGPDRGGRRTCIRSVGHSRSGQRAASASPGCAMTQLPCVTAAACSTSWGALPRLARNWLSACLPAPTWKRGSLPFTFMTEAAIKSARSMRWTRSRRYRRPRVRG
jgi:hypothetical protein